MGQPGPSDSSAERLLAAARESFALGDFETTSELIGAMSSRGDSGLSSLLLDLDERASSGRVWRLMATSGDQRVLRALARHVDDAERDAGILVTIGEFEYLVAPRLAASYELARVGARAGAAVLLSCLRTGTDDERFVASHGLAVLLPPDCASHLADAVANDELVEVRLFAAVGLARLGEATWITTAIGVGIPAQLRQRYWGDPRVVSAQIQEIGPLSQPTLDGLEAALQEQELDDWWAFVLSDAVEELRWSAQGEAG